LLLVGLGKSIFEGDHSRQSTRIYLAHHQPRPIDRQIHRKRRIV
jgi:hypothetical protein